MQYLLTIVVIKDEFGEIVPLAFAIHDSETIETYTKVFTVIKEQLGVSPSCVFTDSGVAIVPAAQ